METQEIIDQLNHMRTPAGALGMYGDDGLAHQTVRHAVERLDQLQRELNELRNPPKCGGGHDALCPARPCYGLMEDKGSFTNGRGYTSYKAKPELVCRERHLHGCPDCIPPADPAIVADLFGAIRAADPRPTVARRLATNRAQRVIELLCADVRRQQPMAVRIVL